MVTHRRERRLLQLKLLRAVVPLFAVLPAFAQYASPSILSRGEAPSGMAEASESGFHLSATVTANYTSGLAGVLAPTAQGQPSAQGTAGGGLAVGITEGLNWQNTQLDLKYNGSFQDYAQTTSYSGYSQGLSIGLTHLFSPRVALTVRENAGMFSHFLPSAVSLNPSSTFEPSQSTVPTTDFFNNLTIFSSTQANLEIQETPRLSFNLGGTYFLNELRSSALFGAQGGTATGDVQYSLSPHVAVGVNYNFTRFAYTQGIGGAYIHSGAFTAAYRIGPSTEISGFVGPSRMETSFEQAVPINPALLAILCPSTERVSCALGSAVFISHSVSWIPNYRVRFSKGFGHGTAYVMAGESTTPGNGLFLTSRTTTAQLGYSYSFLRDWTFNVGGTYLSALSAGNAVGQYRDFGATYRMTRRIAGPITFISTFTAMRYSSASVAGYDRLIYIASAGFRFTSGDRPMGSF
jgi:hypothetical protein